MVNEILGARLTNKDLQRCAAEAEEMSLGVYIPDELIQLEELIRAKNPDLADRSLMQLFQDDTTDLEIELPFDTEEDAAVWVEILNDFADRFEFQLMETSCGKDFAFQMIPMNPAYWTVVADHHHHLDHLYGLANLALVFLDNIRPQ